MSEQPWTASKRRLELASYLAAKVVADDGVLSGEGCQGFWELSIAKENHTDIQPEKCVPWA
jgi:hypothetical protein